MSTFAAKRALEGDSIEFARENVATRVCLNLPSNSVTAAALSAASSLLVQADTDKPPLRIAVEQEERAWRKAQIDGWANVVAGLPPAPADLALQTPFLSPKPARTHNYTSLERQRASSAVGRTRAAAATPKFKRSKIFLGKAEAEESSTHKKAVVTRRTSTARTPNSSVRKGRTLALQPASNLTSCGGSAPCAEPPVDAPPTHKASSTKQHPGVFAGWVPRSGPEDFVGEVSSSSRLQKLIVRGGDDAAPSRITACASRRVAIGDSPLTIGSLQTNIFGALDECARPSRKEHTVNLPHSDDTSERSSSGPLSSTNVRPPPMAPSSMPKTSTISISDRAGRRCDSGVGSPLSSTGTPSASTPAMSHPSFTDERSTGRKRGRPRLGISSSPSVHFSETAAALSKAGCRRKHTL